MFIHKQFRNSGDRVNSNDWFGKRYSRFDKNVQRLYTSFEHNWMFIHTYIYCVKGRLGKYEAVFIKLPLCGGDARKELTTFHNE